MSGGVDSSMAAKLMKDKGYECIGCTMKLYQNEDAGVPRSKTCCSLDDVEAARSIAFSLDMPFYVLNFTEDFRTCVMDRFVQSYEAGRTPNPCIDCNRFMKFDKLYERAVAYECDCIVTGHYARIECEGGKYVMKKALDETKDQSYVLYSLTQEQLAHVQFPLGNMRKEEVRKVADASGFVNAHKADSQDICFVPDGDYAAFIERHTGKVYPEGDFVDSEGHVLGTHKGIVHYTIGQRKGLGIPFGKPMYVKGVDVEENKVILGENDELFSTTLKARDFNWISGEIPEGEVRCKAKIRYRHAEQAATVKVLDDQTVEVVFDEPQRAITPGQAVVLYDGDVVLGGGTIVSK